MVYTLLWIKQLQVLKLFSSTISGSVDGNAATATKLATARTIAGVSFDGSENIDLSLNGFSDVKANTTEFENSILLGQTPQGTLDDAQFNVGLGYGVFNSLTSGKRNMAIGYNALNKLTTGTGNSAIGSQTISKITSGSRNVAIGRQAGIKLDNSGSVLNTSLSDGTENTYIGAKTSNSTGNSENSSGDPNNETVIGANAIGQGSNTVTIGDDNVEKIYLSEDRGAEVYVGSLTLGAGGDELQITESSDDITIKNTIADKDLIFKVNDGGTDTEVMRINADEPSLKGSGSSSLYGFNANLNAVTSFSSNDYELQATDNGKVVTIDNSETDAFVSIPNGLPAGFNCLIVQKGNHQTTIQKKSGDAVTIANRSSEVKTAGQYAVVSVINIGNDGTNDIYILSGDTSD